jgi:anti-sigma factor RsiW
MSCSPFDLRDYFLQELANPQQRQVEAHVKTCAPCREELDRLRITEAALRSMADEEIPQRIAFVSNRLLGAAGWPRSGTPALAWGSRPRPCCRRRWCFLR